MSEKNFKDYVQPDMNFLIKRYPTDLSTGIAVKKRIVKNPFLTHNIIHVDVIDNVGLRCPNPTYAAGRKASGRRSEKTKRGSK